MSEAFQTGERRRQKILDLLMERGSVTVDDLAASFRISRMTVHRDLDQLAMDQLVRKVRGGATIESSTLMESDFRWRAKVALQEKAAIARAALDFVEPGQSVIIDAGTTVGALAELLVERRPLTVITNNLAAIEALALVDRITLITLGGQYSRRFHGFFGMATEEMLAGLRADVAFLGTSSVSGTLAFHQDQDIVKTKRGMIASATRSYLLIDRSKFGQTALHVLTDLSKFAAIVTGPGGLPDAATRPLQEANIRLVEAEDTPAVPVNNLPDVIDTK
jgi:DeoR/GlpR family transcriptional regulator of sugar metabolism